MTFKRGKRLKTAAKSRIGQSKGNVERRLNRLLLQLIISAALFLLVFVGGGLIPNQVCDVFASVHQVIAGDNSLLDSVQALGSAVSSGEDWKTAVRDWCVDTFLPASLEKESQTGAIDYFSAGDMMLPRLWPEPPAVSEAAPTAPFV